MRTCNNCGYPQESGNWAGATTAVDQPIGQPQKIVGVFELQFDVIEKWGIEKAVERAVDDLKARTIVEYRFMKGELTTCPDCDGKWDEALGAVVHYTDCWRAPQGKAATAIPTRARPENVAKPLGAEG